MTFSPPAIQAGFWDDLVGKGQQWQSWGDKAKDSGNAVSGGAAKAVGSGLEWLGKAFGGGAAQPSVAALPGGREGGDRSLGWKAPAVEALSGGGAGKEPAIKKWFSGIDWIKPEAAPGVSPAVSAAAKGGGGGKAALPPGKGKSFFSALVGAKKGGSGLGGGLPGGFGAVKGKACEDAGCMGAPGSKSGSKAAASEKTKEELLSKLPADARRSALVGPEKNPAHTMPAGRPLAISEKALSAVGGLLRAGKGKDSPKGSEDNKVLTLDDHIRKAASGDKDSQERVIKEYKSLDRSVVYTEKDAKIAKKVGQKIGSDKDIREARKNWDKLSDDDKKKTLQRVAEIHSKAMGMKEVAPIEFESMPAKDGMIVHGYFSPAQDKVVINSEPQVLDNMDRLVNTVVHEYSHRYQYEAAEDFREGKIKKDDSGYVQAQWFDRNWRWYITADENGYQAYKNQPLEAHSFSMGDKAGEQASRTFQEQKRGFVDKMMLLLGWRMGRP